MFGITLGIIPSFFKGGDMIEKCYNLQLYDATPSRPIV
jgi:hypothetical protein